MQTVNILKKSERKAKEMCAHEWKRPRNITAGALLAALGAVIQISPLYLPLIGVSLSALATLPVAIAAYLHGITGVLTFLISGVLICCWSLPQAVIFLCGSGLLGLALGIMLQKNCHFLIAATGGALLLTAGFLTAGALLGIPILPWLTGAARFLLTPVLFICSLLYSAIWVPVLKVLLGRLGPYIN